jgi:tetratricopeptide (TPR) repeat protein
MKASRPVRYLYQATFALGLILGAAAPAYSQAEIPGYPQAVQAYDRREVALLPRYCLYTQSFRLANVPGSQDQQETESWYARLGPTFHAMHHYCWGLMKTNRAVFLARNPTTRQFYLNDSLIEFDYVIERAPVDFALLPEILTKKGENLVRLGMGPLGIMEFQRAIELKPNYWPPYAQLSDYYKDTGNTQKSREYLEKGLAYQPEARDLTIRLAELEAADVKRKAAPQSTEKPTKPRKISPGKDTKENHPAKMRLVDPIASAPQ